MQSISERIEHVFRNHFDEEYILVNSPGRVNLVGGHTDYNQGFVLPAAVESSIVFAISVAKTGHTECYAVDKEQTFEADLTDSPEESKLGWPNYLLGVVEQLKKRGYHVPNFHCVFGGNVPIGAGMSSSAALEGGLLFGLDRLMGWGIDRVEMAHICQDAENQFVGVQCGIMDQFSSLCGKKDHVIKLDCRSLEYEYYPFKQDNIQIVLCDTQIRRELAVSEYNIRRSQCEDSVQILQKHGASVKSLRDVSLDLLKTHKERFTPTVYERCKFIVEENERVLQACRYLEEKDMASFGQQMFQSHDGLSNMYEVSCKELDFLIAQARQHEGVLGARMMGGGFGGCTVNLVEEQHVPSFKQTVKENYKQQFGQQIDVHQTKISDGTSVIDEETTATRS